MFKRRLKAERDGDILFVPHLLSFRERFDALKLGIDALRARELESDLRKALFLDGVEMFLRGYVYEAFDLTQDEDYQAIKFLEWLETLDPDVRAAVMAEYEDR